jgi:hypothetical protein
MPYLLTATHLSHCDQLVDAPLQKIGLSVQEYRQLSE